MKRLNDELSELKIEATSLFSDASSIRNSDREKFLREFIEKYKHLKNSKS